MSGKSHQGDTTKCELHGHGEYFACKQRSCLATAHPQFTDTCQCETGDLLIQLDCNLAQRKLAQVSAEKDAALHPFQQ